MELNGKIVKTIYKKEEEDAFAI